MACPRPPAQGLPMGFSTGVRLGGSKAGNHQRATSCLASNQLRSMACGGEKIQPRAGEQAHQQIHQAGLRLVLGHGAQRRPGGESARGGGVAGSGG